MIRHLRPFLACAAGALLVAGCDSPLAPSDVVGRYVLERIGTDPLPAVAIDADYVTVTLLADTLQLNAGGNGSEVRHQRVQAHPSGTVMQDRSDVPLVYRTVDGHLELSYLCPADATCVDVFVAPIIGAPTTDGLVLRIGPDDYVFRRIG